MPATTIAMQNRRLLSVLHRAAVRSSSHDFGRDLPQRYEKSFVESIPYTNVE